MTALQISVALKAFFEQLDLSARVQEYRWHVSGVDVEQTLHGNVEQL